MKGFTCIICVVLVLFHFVFTTGHMTDVAYSPLLVFGLLLVATVNLIGVLGDLIDGR